MKHEIVYLNIEDVIPYYNNPRVNTEAVTLVAESIKAFGFQNPIILDKNNIIIAGHTRYKACLMIGLMKVPCMISDLPEDKARAYRIADNKTSEKSEWDIDKLVIEIQGLDEAEFDLSSLGFDEEELEKLLHVEEEEHETEDEMPITIKKRCEPGDIWELDRHRIVCGDCTNDDAVNGLLDNRHANMVFCDPPFDIDVDFGEQVKKHSKDAHVFVMHSDRNMVEYLKRSTMKFNRFFVANFIFSSPRGNDPYLNHILVSHELNGDAIKHENLQDGFSSIVKMKYRGNIDETRYHKHQKSVDFVDQFIKHYSREHSIVLDLFLGSGTTLISCEKTNRICYGAELEPEFCDAILQRWEDYTGKVAICSREKS